MSTPPPARSPRAIDGFTVVVTKSTVPVGTGDEVERIIRQERPDADFAVVSNPEFLREGAAIDDFKHPDRIVVGLEDERAREVMIDVYRPLYLNKSPLLFTSRRSSELIKYAANAFLAMKITFINEISDLSEQVGATSRTSPTASASMAASARSSSTPAPATAARASRRTRWRW
ncbi:UDP-glucose 6-dehydrogenase YwqF [Methylobrevis pamukkalensis]|uniref:UDP-glucose 6-dehydrogenase n=1 Tax=Methylobrevis pamukkalensis TaxID=1439726 RepID=A0A1E3GQV3_9HYPH|nr:UDP-glucose 6-dehydrogenase YwqF [Methylobrevis pamukkalensis]